MTLLVPAYQVAVDVGATAPSTDVGGDPWVADQQWIAGGWGYTNNRSSRLTTDRAIAGTDDDLLLRTARNNPVEYRFDGVPDGVYEIDVRFAEINGRRPNRRVFDVAAETQFVLALHDISGEVGTFAGDQHTVFVTVTDGQLNLRLGERGGCGPS